MFESSRASGLLTVNVILKWRLMMEKGIEVDVYVGPHGENMVIGQLYGWQWQWLVV